LKKSQVRHAVRERSTTAARVTLARALSKLGSASRSQARLLVTGGRVRVNGRVVLDPDLWIDLAHDRITVNSEPIRATAFRCVLLNKPAGVVTTRSDERGRRTVFDVLGASGDGLKVVGRLDMETTGLLLLTTDTRLADALTDPRSGVEKVYELETDRPLDAKEIDAIATGMEIRIPGAVHRTKPSPITSLGGCRYRLALTEGKNRQVRRMVESFGASIRQLERTTFAGMPLGALAPGEWRALTDEETSFLRTLSEQARESSRT
jgi:23S rRNA pseudouridine2605 synthase